MRISDWSSDVCSADLVGPRHAGLRMHGQALHVAVAVAEDLRTGIVAPRAGVIFRHAAVVVQPDDGAEVVGDVLRLLHGVVAVAEGHVEGAVDGEGEARAEVVEIGRAHVWTPVNNAHTGCRL